MKKSILILLLILTLTSCNSDNADVGINDTKEEKVAREESKNNEKVVEKNENFKMLDKDLEEKDILDTATSQMMYAYPAEMDEMIARSDNVIIARVKEKGESRKFDNGGFVYTEIKVKVLNTLKGNVETGDATIEQTGGTVTVEEYAKHNPEQSNEKHGFNKLSKEEMKIKIHKRLS